jgi:hypothetical protein
MRFLKFITDQESKPVKVETKKSEPRTNRSKGKRMNYIRPTKPTIKESEE